MSLIVAVNKTYNSYFSPKHIGTINPNKKYKPIDREEKSTKTYQKILDFKKNETKKMYARDIMSEVIHSISPNENLEQASKEMAKFSIHHLIVMDNKELVGLITDRDLLKNIDSPRMLIKEMMNEKVLLCKKDTEIRLISKVLYEEQISSIVVVDEDHNALGIITRSDLLNFIVKFMPLEAWA